MLDVLTILEYARKGALADYEKACMMHRLLNVKETQALIDDTWGTAKELTRLMDLKAEQVKQTGRDTKEDARKRIVSADRSVQSNEQALHKQVIAEAPYVIAIKWVCLGQIEYPCESYKGAEESFELAKREVRNGHATEAHVFEQSEGQRIPVMGIARGNV